MRIIISGWGLDAPIFEDKFHNEIPDPKDKKLLIIPCAGYDSYLCGKREVEYAINFGFEKENIYVFDELNPNKFSDLQLDYIYVPGGNTFKLFKAMKDTCFDKIIIDYVTKKEVTYIGVSAGVYLLGHDIEFVKLLEDNNVGIDEFTGLNLLNNVNILCHFYDSRYHIYKWHKANYPTIKMYLFSDENIAKFNGKDWY